MAHMVKNLPAMQETWVWHPGLGRSPWRSAWQPTPVFLPGESPWTEEPGRLQSMGSQWVGHDWVTTRRTALMNNTEVLQTTRKLNGCCSSVYQRYNSSHFWFFICNSSLPILVFSNNNDSCNNKPLSNISFPLPWSRAQESQRQSFCVSCVPVLFCFSARE